MSDYLKLSSTKLQKCTIIACNIIRKYKLRFQYIACTGYSGALIASLVAVKLKKKLIIVRKSQDSSHGEIVEGEDTELPYIIIDDFMHTGATMRRVLKIMNKKRQNMQCAGIVLYDTDRSWLKWQSFDKSKFPKIYWNSK